MNQNDVNAVEITSLSQIHGQKQVTDMLKLCLDAYFNIRSSHGDPNPMFGPVLMSGPSGTGKTLFAKATHAELGNSALIETNGVAVNKKAELFSILLNAKADTTIFIDEAQAMNATSQNILLTALSEKKVYVPAGINSMHSHIILLAGLTMILATTHEYQLNNALRNRIRIHCRFNYYSITDLIQIVRQRADALRWNYESDAVLKIIAKRAKRTPRLALNRNLQTCWYVAQSHGSDVITLEDTEEAFRLMQIDEYGLEALDRSYLHVLCQYGKTSLGVISSKISQPPLTVQRVLEPYLLQEGFIVKENSARIITQKGKDAVKTGNQMPKDSGYEKPRI